jgi:Protein of unknown function (DUF2934)
MNINPTKKIPIGVACDSQELEKKIRQRAYELYAERLWENGHDVEDWLRAEEGIMEQEARPMAA